MSSNLELYERVAEVPKEAKKPINAGRLKGMTDINPMWRIQKLTEEFGSCGFGWTYEIKREWSETGANGVVCAFMDIELFVKKDGEWSKGIPGTGGSTFVAKETKGLYTSDECYKMALTDAISVACKALGFGANVYWEAGRSKYSEEPQVEEPQVEEPQVKYIGEKERNQLLTAAGGDVDLIKTVLAEKGFQSSKVVPMDAFSEVLSSVEWEAEHGTNRQYM